MRYPIAIESGGAKHAYGVVVPDLPGCFSAGDTLDEAIANTEEAVLAWLESAKSVAPPPASTIERLRRQPEYKGWTWAVASVDMDKLVGG